MLKNIYRNNLLSKRRGKLRIRKRKLARYPVTSSTRSLIPVIIAQRLSMREGEGFGLTSKRILRKEGTAATFPRGQDSAVYTRFARGNTVPDVNSSVIFKRLGAT